jgi:hypothetical protein
MLGHILSSDYVQDKTDSKLNIAKHWFINGERHREDSPAIEYASGVKMWYLNGNLYRTDGPAIEWASEAS